MSIPTRTRETVEYAPMLTTLGEGDTGVGSVASDTEDARSKSMIRLGSRNSERVCTQHYNFHGIFRLAITTDDPAALRYFNQEYGAFEDSAPGTPDLLVNVGRFSMTPQADDRTFGKYRLTGEWIYGSARYKVAWWRFALCGMTSPTTELVFYGGLFAPYFLQHFLIEQIMRYKIVQKGFVLVHGGCVADRGNSVIFPGLGHAGKTALAVQQVQAGRKFQADDYTFVSASGNTYSYPRRLHVSDHTKEAFPEAVRNLKMRHRFSIKVKSLIYYMTLKYGDLDEALQMEELVPGTIVEDVARLGAAILLTAIDGDKLKGPTPLDPDTLVTRMTAINCLEGKPFNDILLGLNYYGKAPSPGELWGRERDVLRRALITVAGYEVLVPTHAPRPAATVESTGRIMNGLLERMDHAVLV